MPREYKDTYQLKSHYNPYRSGIPERFTSKTVINNSVNRFHYSNSSEEEEDQNNDPPKNIHSELDVSHIKVADEIRSTNKSISYIEVPVEKVVIKEVEKIVEVPVERIVVNEVEKIV